MKGVIIAAGLGRRMGSLTEDLPKCMLPINGRPLLHHTMDHMRAAGCTDFVVIVGYKSDRIDAQGATIVRNEDYENNNILHSLMAASDHLEGPVMCSYSDIWVEPSIHEKLRETKGDIVLGVDSDWLPYYDGRKEHPVPEAENVFFDNQNQVRQIGKHLEPRNAGALRCGEFLGLWRMSSDGNRLFRDTFHDVDGRFDRDAPFQHAPHWRTAYITDMLQEMTDANIAVDCAVIERGWAELDTTEDYQRLPDIAERQRLFRYIESR